MSVERDLALPGAAIPERVRLSRELQPDAEGRWDPETVGREIAELRSALDAALRSAQLTPSAPRERSVEELLETYRPRQGELVELLREDGEITETEYTRLRSHLAVTEPGAPASAPGHSRPGPAPNQPLAAAPLERDTAPTHARPVEDLLRAYEIASLKQAGAVRARRQISYDEYMSLKRHFSRPVEPAAPP
ncbi:MAG: hypothetical protein L3K04_00730 [Thermoplasmata archaeon]|nr:hypothetical protein [Thermoplasmata archaeon]MCI4340859.1 hypothetical protein [Thermoplasmata archaeon]